jgi:hypothetical protein
MLRQANESWQRMLQREAFYINYESISANFHDAKTSSVQSTKRASEKSDEKWQMTKHVKQ